MCAAHFQGALRRRGFYGAHFTGRRSLLGNNGAFEQEIYGRAFRQNDFHVCAIIYYELLHQLLCVLWFHISNPMPRTILTEEEIVNEYKAIKKARAF